MKKNEDKFEFIKCYRDNKEQVRILYRCKNCGEEIDDGHLFTTKKMMCINNKCINDGRWGTYKISEGMRKQRSKNLSISHSSNKVKRKKYETMKKNGTLYSFTSKWEKEVYKYLLQLYPTVKFNEWGGDKYPHRCDFIIFELDDLYIELQGYYTHGGKPFENTEGDIQLLKGMREDTIKIWTISDVEKRNDAYKNNLNFIEIWYDNEGYIKYSKPELENKYKELCSKLLEIGKNT